MTTEGSALEPPGSEPAQPPAGARRRGGIGGRLRTYFFAGLLVVAPVGLTIAFVWYIIDLVDGWVTALIPPEWNPGTRWPGYGIPGYGLVIVLVGFTLIGALTANFVGRMVVRSYESVLERMPIIRGIYGFMKQLFELVFSSRAESFRQVVLVEFPRPGAWSIGFITGVTEGEIQNITVDEVVNVFVPATPNPTSGFVMFVPRGDLIHLNMTVEEGFKMVVSCGIVTPPDRRPAELQERQTVPSRAVNPTGAEAE